jgi:hypothetical protein
MINNKHLDEASPMWARQIRQLAKQCHQLIRAEELDPIEVELILARIDALRHELAAMPAMPVLRWLDSLREEVEEATTCLDDSSFVAA